MKVKAAAETKYSMTDCYAYSISDQYRWSFALTNARDTLRIQR